LKVHRDSFHWSRTLVSCVSHLETAGTLFQRWVKLTGQSFVLGITDRAMTVGDVLPTPLIPTAAWFALSGAPQPGQLSPLNGENASI
jgi:hypothetical protein